jgi:hypothetical protein
LEGFLRDKKIEARTYNDKALRLFLFLCPPQPTFQVQVRDKFFKMSLENLSASPPSAVENVVHCPDCGSLRISYPQLTRRFVLPTIFLHLGIIFRFIKHQAYCESCHCVWSLEKTPAAVEQRPVPHSGS